MALRTSLDAQPHLYIGDTAGRPLDGGKVYFGQVNKDPELYPINVFYDEGLSIPAAQPVRTKGGFMNANGDMTEIYALETRYSVKVLDSYGRQVFYKEDMQSGLDVSNQLGSISEMLALVGATTGQKVFVEGLQGGAFVYDNTKSAINDGGLIFDGWVRDIRDKRITPEMFGAKPNDATFDNTTALNAAFATGFDLYGLLTDTYHVTQPISSKGQRTIGGWKIHCKRNIYRLYDDHPDKPREYLINESVNTVDAGFDESGKVKALFVESAWDLCELLIIKSLGINILYHYCGFINTHTADRLGSIAKMLDNAKTAGLRVILGTEQNPEISPTMSGGVRDYTNTLNKIRSINSNPTIFGYATFDEPAYRDISVEVQEQFIAALRTVTDKSLVTVGFKDNPFVSSPYSDLHDYVFTNVYSKNHYTDQDLPTRIAADLAEMRRAYGVQKGTLTTNVLPCIGAFTYRFISPTDYTSDLAQILPTAKMFGKVGGGSFAAFVWDGYGDVNILEAVRENPLLRGLIKDVASNLGEKTYITEPYIFGSADGQANKGLNALLSTMLPVETGSSSDHTFSSYPVKVKGYQSTNNDRNTTASVPTISGLMFKGNYARFSTAINARNFLTTFLEYAYPEKTGVLATTVKFCTSKDTQLFNEQYVFVPFQEYQIIKQSIKLTDFNGSNLCFEFRDEQAVPTTFYRQSIRGAIVMTNW